MGLVARLDDEVLALLRRLAGQGRLEHAVGAGGDGDLGGTEGDLHGSARLGLAVDVGLTGLQDSVVGEDGRKLQVAGLGQGGDEQQDGGKAGHAFQTTPRQEGSQ